MIKKDRLKWVEQNQGKHFCQCGCGQEIIIKLHQYYDGIPKYLKGHQFIGKHLSKETKNKISESHIGMKVSEETKKKLSEINIGEKNPNYGLKRSKETCKKISDANKGIGNHMLGKIGEKHHNWQGGHTKYCYKFNDKCKESNRDKFNRKCFLCGLLEEDNKFKTGKNKGRQISLHVHHIDYNKEQGCNSDWKLVPLCSSCHSKTHGKHVRDHYEHLISKLLYIKIMLFEYENKIDWRSIL